MYQPRTNATVLEEINMTNRGPRNNADLLGDSVLTSKGIGSGVEEDTPVRPVTPVFANDHQLPAAEPSPSGSKALPPKEGSVRDKSGEGWRKGVGPKFPSGI